MAENIIEKANKILTFRKYIREACRKKGLEYPLDEKIAEYIADCGGDNCVYDLNDFMCDYENKIGVFKDPFVDFKAELDKINFGDNPTEAEMREFFNKSGNNVALFIREHTINSYHGLEKDTLLATLELSEETLVALWNTFIEESAMYGEDSYIYDLAHKKDVDYINVNFPNDKKAELTRIIRNAKLHNENVRFIQWYNLNDNSIHVKDDIKGIIVAYWSDIFERVMAFPTCYCNIIGRFDYFSEVFWVVCMKHLGFTYDEKNGKLNPIEK
jgi:hypothetical protein